MAKQETEDRWRERVRAWKSSGLTCGRFAEREGLNAGTLSYWRSKLRKLDAARASRSAEPLTFVELAPPPRECTDAFELVFGSGLRLQVPVNFDGSALVRLLDVLEQRT